MLHADIARCPGVGSDAEGWREGCDDCLRRTSSGPVQAERVPLTITEIINIWGDKSDGPSNAEIMSFARAIERAHGIKPLNAKVSGDPHGGASTALTGSA